MWPKRRAAHATRFSTTPSFKFLCHFHLCVFLPSMFRAGPETCNLVGKATINYAKLQFYKIVSLSNSIIYWLYLHIFHLKTNLNYATVNNFSLCFCFYVYVFTSFAWIDQFRNACKWYWDWFSGRIHKIESEGDNGLFQCVIFCWSW